MTAGQQSCHISNSEAETEQIGAALVALASPGSVIALDGDLGAGKTCLVRGAAQALGISQPITSPTFAIVNTYRSATAELVHMDLYRLGGPDEALALGFDEYLATQAFVFIEWPQRAAELLPPHTLRVNIRLGERPDQRRIEIGADARPDGA